MHVSKHFWISLDLYSGSTLPRRAKWKHERRKKSEALCSAKVVGPCGMIWVGDLLNMVSAVLTLSVRWFPSRQRFPWLLGPCWQRAWTSSTHTHTYLRMHAHTRTHACEHTRTYTHACTHSIKKRGLGHWNWIGSKKDSMHKWCSLNVCIYVYIYIYIYIVFRGCKEIKEGNLWLVYWWIFILPIQNCLPLLKECTSEAFLWTTNVLNVVIPNWWGLTYNKKFFP